MIMSCSDNMVSADKMVSSNRRRSSSLGNMVSSGSRRQSPDMLVSNRNLTSSQKRMVGNIKDTAYEVGYNKRHIEDIVINGIHVRILRGNDVDISDRKDYKISHQVRWAGNNSAKDTTWAQLYNFLRSNVIFNMAMYGETTYKPDEFMCEDFAAALHNNAESAGIKCASVDLFRLDSNRGHAIVMFNTTDKGWVFVDPTAGMVFSKRNFFDQGRNYVLDFAIVGEKEITRSQLNRAIKSYFEKKYNIVEIQW